MVWLGASSAARGDKGRTCDEAGAERERMSRLKLIAMVALVIAGLSLLVIGPMDDRSINWVNVVLAAACFAGAIYLRPRKSK